MTIRTQLAESTIAIVHMEVKIVDVTQITFTKLSISLACPKSIEYPFGREYISNAVSVHAFKKGCPKIIKLIIVVQ